MEASGAVISRPGGAEWHDTQFSLRLSPCSECLKLNAKARAQSEFPGGLPV